METLATDVSPYVSEIAINYDAKGTYDYMGVDAYSVEDISPTQVKIIKLSTGPNNIKVSVEVSGGGESSGGDESSIIHTSPVVDLPSTIVRDPEDAGIPELMYEYDNNGDLDIVSALDIEVLFEGGPTFVTATGGTVTEDGDYKIHTFDADDDFIVTVPGEVSYLLAGGGGGGGSRCGGGGGAGAILAESGFPVTAQSYSIVVGLGGAGGTGEAVPGSNGLASVFDTITALGGGGGGSNNNSAPTQAGRDGGCGGGSSGLGITVGLGDPGFDGGLGFPGANYGGGGGGGNFSVGVDATSTVSGPGGTGLLLDITGASVGYGGGGGGGLYLTVGTPGTATEGGGAGGPSGSNGVDGVDGKGGGGGGAGQGYIGGAGGSGVVIIRYRFQ